MNVDSEINIEDLVDLKVLQRLQDTFAQAMGVAAVTVNRDGVPITEASNFCTVCLMIRSTDAGLKRCQQCDSDGGRVAHELGEPYAYKCHGGFLDAAAPIIIDGHYMGCILCGQVIPADAEVEFRQDVMAINLPLGLPAEDLEEALDGMESLPRERFQAAVEMLSVTANHIIEMAMANKAQSQLLKEAQKRAALQAVLQETRLKALKAQINPHFLFNSLTLLSYTALEEQATRTEEIAYTLSDLLRYSLRNMTTMVELGEEMDMVNQYLAIQKIRFGDRLESHIEFDPEIEKYEIPCMVLQPLVENAVIHGAEPLTRTVKVIVKAYKEDGHLALEVADTGAGMPSDIVEIIRSGDFDSNGQSIGLQNVMQRLRSDYGDSFAVQVQSETDKGTRIRLNIELRAQESQPPSAGPRWKTPLAPGVGNQINLDNIGVIEKPPDAPEVLQHLNDEILLTPNK